MADSPPSLDSKGDTLDDTGVGPNRGSIADTPWASTPAPPMSPAEEPDRGSTSSTPLWLKLLFGIIAIGLILLLVVLHLTGSAGPGTH